jgi:sulfatase modifying factor 1
MNHPFRLCVAVFTAILSVPLSSVGSSVTGGEMIVDFDAAALAALNHGTDPNIPAMVLEEFFGGVEDSSRTRTRIVNEHLVPGYVEIPATNLHFDINGPSVVNLTQRFSQPTAMQFNPDNVSGTVTGKIGLRGVLRWIGDFEGIFMMGDFEFKHDPTRINAGTGRTGWVFFNRFDNFQIIAYETKNVTTVVRPGLLTMTGTMMISEQMGNAFLPGNVGTPVGTFTLHAKVPGADFMPIETVRVGNAGNAADPATGYGSVPYDYWIATTETTNAQWARFLNAVDPDGTNPRDLYNSNMSDDAVVVRGGIDFISAAPAGTKYQPKPLWANKPVNFVSYYDAARFANWLSTGDTELGFYAFSGPTTFSSEGPYGPAFGRPYCAIASENEWYKAAYHKNDGVTANYFLYATRSNTAPIVATSTAIGDIANPGVNVANYDFGATWNDSEGLGNMTTVASAGPGSASPYGTYDQSGNQFEWCGALTGLNRVMRGGSLWRPLEDMQSTHRGSYFPESGGGSLGFRITSSAPIIPTVTKADQNLAVTVGAPDAQNVRTFNFQSRSDTDYRFDYSDDLTSWYRLHNTIPGTGGQISIPVPQAFRAGERCFVRSVTWRR